MSKFIIYAPNINVGGGRTLLEELVASRNGSLHFVFDSRVRGLFGGSLDANAEWVDKGIISRLGSEFRLLRESKKETLVVFCLNGTPPILKSNAKIILYLHNKLLLLEKIPAGYPFFTLVSLVVQRAILRWRIRSVDTVMVQSKSMKYLFETWSRRHKIKRMEANLRILPFAKIKPLIDSEKDNLEVKWNFDFCYIADGQPHKNHLNLFAALEILSKNNIFPSVAITLSDTETNLCFYANNLKFKKLLRISNLGILDEGEIVELLRSSKALLFPSLQESFGLPLVEAMHLGRPIVASELDYVRDICAPQETFDPDSPRSIARAICRFMEISEPLQIVISGNEFIEELQKYGHQPHPKS